MRNLLFAAFAVLLLLALLGVLFRYYLRTKSAADVTWDDLLKRLARVDRDNIARIALDAIDESGQHRNGEGAFSLEPSVIWSLLGGLEGLQVLERNCQVLVELAAYLQRWYPEALVVAEQLRLNAREIEWHVSRLKGAAQTGNLQAAFADYAQRAVVTYYLMTRHLLDLYEHASVPQFAQLQRAL
ncbi:MAG TPA: hypothetical protein VGN01_03605 [Acidobacteriaceae bacterium]